MQLSLSSWNRNDSGAAATSSPPASTSSQGSGIGSSRDTRDGQPNLGADKRFIQPVQDPVQDHAESTSNGSDAHGLQQNTDGDGKNIHSGAYNTVKDIEHAVEDSSIENRDHDHNRNNADIAGPAEIASALKFRRPKQRANSSGAKRLPAKSFCPTMLPCVSYWIFGTSSIQIYVSKKHGAAKALALAFSDAVFIPNSDDWVLLEVRLAKLGITWEEAVRSPVWNKKLWRRVRRWIPPPSVFEPLIREVSDKFGALIDAKTTQPLFNKAAHKTAKRYLEAIGKDQVSNPVGIELYTHRGPCGGPDGKPDDGVRVYSCQRGTNSLEGGIPRNVRQRFPKSGVTPYQANACLSDYVLVHNSTVRTFNRTGKADVGHFDLWLTVKLHRMRRETAAYVPAHPTNMSETVNPLLYAPSTETFGIVPIVEVAQKSSNIEPYWVESGAFRFEPLKWSPRNLLHKNMGRAIQQMQIQLPADRKLRHTLLAKRQGTRFAVLHVHTSTERALYKHLLSHLEPSTSRDQRAIRIVRIAERWNAYAFTNWEFSWSSLADAQAIMNMAENDVKATQAMITDPSRGRNVSPPPTKPPPGHKPPVSGMLTDAEVEASNPQTSFIRPSGAMDTNNNGPCAGIATSGSSVSVVTGKVMRHCRFCGQASCKFKGSASARQGSEILCENPCVDCGKMYGLSEERDPNTPESPRFCKGLITAEMGGRARDKTKCHNHKPL